MTAWILIIVLLGEHGFGHNVEFATREACENAQKLVGAVMPSASLVCAPKGLYVQGVSQ